MLSNQHTFLLTIASAGLCFSQTFETASVEPSRPSANTRFTPKGGPGTEDPGRISYINVALRRVLLNAYDLKSDQILGPDWLNTLRYNIVAKVPDGVNERQFQSMLGILPEDRFKMAVYALVPGKNGPKWKATAAASPPVEETVATVKGAEGKDGFPVAALSGSGLVIETKDGRARITAPNTAMAKYFSPDGMNPDGGAEPSIYSAVREQLGLRLDARKGPVDLLIIDHAEKIPAEN